MTTSPSNPPFKCWWCNRSFQGERPADSYRLLVAHIKEAQHKSVELAEPGVQEAAELFEGTVFSK